LLTILIFQEIARGKEAKTVLREMPLVTCARITYSFENIPTEYTSTSRRQKNSLTDNHIIAIFEEKERFMFKKVTPVSWNHNTFWWKNHDSSLCEYFH